MLVVVPVSEVLVIVVQVSEFLVVVQVLQFVIAHIDVFSGILRERHPILTVDSLKELALVTGVIGRVALDGI